MHTTGEKFPVKFTGKEDIWTEIRATNYSNVEDVDLNQVFLKNTKPIGEIIFFLLYTANEMTGDQVFDYFKERKVRPATFRELIGFGRYYPSIVESREIIIGLGSIVDMGQGGFLDGIRVPALKGDPSPLGKHCSLVLEDYQKDEVLTYRRMLRFGVGKPQTVRQRSDFLVSNIT